MKKISTTLLLLLSFVVFSQEKISLNDCYQWVDVNYPLAKKNDLLAQKNALDLDVIQTEILPQVQLSAQASYQSDVIGVPIATLTPPNKDQYRATLSINQLIYAGGAIAAKKEVKKASLYTQQKQVEVQMYPLKKQINQLYFSVLLVQEKYLLLVAKQTLLQTKLKEVKSGIKNGMVLPSSDKVIQAELLKVTQQFLELSSQKNTLIKTLSSLTRKTLQEDTVFEQPEVYTALSPSLHRPELDLFRLKKEEIQKSEVLLSKENAPKLAGFANTGYGNPGLNMLDNSFQGFYVVGVQFNWKVFDWNANAKKRKALLINKDQIDNEKKVFELNTRIEMNQQQDEIDKLVGFIIADLQIVDLRKEVLKSTESQLKNGVITAASYLVELTNLYNDENLLKTHEIQLLLVKSNYNVTKGL